MVSVQDGEHPSNDHSHWRVAANLRQDSALPQTNRSPSSIQQPRARKYWRPLQYVLLLKPRYDALIQPVSARWLQCSHSQHAFAESDAQVLKFSKVESTQAY